MSRLALALIVTALLLAVGDFGDGTFDWWLLILALLIPGLILDHRSRRSDRQQIRELDRLAREARR